MADFSDAASSNGDEQQQVDDEGGPAWETARDNDDDEGEVEAFSDRSDGYDHNLQQEKKSLHHDKQILQQEKQTLQHEKQMLRAEVDKVRNDSAVDQERLRHLNGKLQQLNEKMTQLSEKQLQLDAMERENRNLKEETQKHEMQALSSNELVKTLRDQLTLTSKSEEQLKLQTKQLMEQNQSLQADLLEKIASETSKFQKMAKLSAENESLVEELERKENVMSERELEERQLLSQWRIQTHVSVATKELRLQVEMAELKAAERDKYSKSLDDYSRVLRSDLERFQFFSLDKRITVDVLSKKLLREEERYRHMEERHVALEEKAHALKTQLASFVEWDGLVLPFSVLALCKDVAQSTAPEKEAVRLE
eukprot:jgi/Phyca11/18513/fgenesh1_pg.PHYCAscaffold_37_\